MKDLDVLALNTGRVFLDLIFMDAERLPEPGEEVFYDRFALCPGGSFNTAAGLARLGLKVALVEDLGNDPLSDYLVRRIEAEGIAPDLIRRHDREVFSLSVSMSGKHDRRFISHVTEMDRPLESIEVLDRFKPRHVNMPGMRLEEDVVRFAKEAHAKGATVSIECQCQESGSKSPLLPKLIASADVFFCNGDEARNLTGQSDVEQGLKELAGLGPLCVVKMGARGAIAQFGARGKQVHSPAIDVKAIETTGAGDSFSSGFIFGYLQGSSLENCLRMGNICGGLSTTAAGGITAFPTRQKLEEMMAGSREA